MRVVGDCCARVAMATRTLTTLPRRPRGNSPPQPINTRGNVASGGFGLYRGGGFMILDQNDRFSLKLRYASLNSSS